MTHKQSIFNVLELCEEAAENDALIQPYAGANPECLYCLAARDRSGLVTHKIDCFALRLMLAMADERMWRDDV